MAFTAAAAARTGYSEYFGSGANCPAMNPIVLHFQIRNINTYLLTHPLFPVVTQLQGLFFAASNDSIASVYVILHRLRALVLETLFAGRFLIRNLTVFNRSAGATSVVDTALKTKTNHS